jgi:fructose-1,6-bisphosphatase/inositol monophosphatase family enzyme
LDGTVNYFHGIPFFCACVSCHRRPEAADPRELSRALGTVASALYAPAFDECYAAARGRGAESNERRIACEPVQDLAAAVVGVSLGGGHESAEGNARLCTALSSRARKLRSFGSTGYDLAQIAAGRLGGLLQRKVNLWDAAAGALIVEEAGGRAEGRAAAVGRWDIVAAAPGLHGELSRLAREAWEPAV